MIKPKELLETEIDGSTTLYDVLVGEFYEGQILQERGMGGVTVDDFFPIAQRIIDAVVASQTDLSVEGGTTLGYLDPCYPPLIGSYPVYLRSVITANSEALSSEQAKADFEKTTGRKAELIIVKENK